jgi:hypothetical protein
VQKRRKARRRKRRRRKRCSARHYIYYGRGDRKSYRFEASQAVPTRPSAKDRLNARYIVRN